jgi:hypothetical protein
MYSKKLHAGALRSAERRKRELEAPRLAAEVPGLKSLRIEVVEHVPTGTTKHVKHVVVAHAPALFVIPCCDSDCEDGGHDLTREVMAALRTRKQSLSGESPCQGSVRSGHCNRRITYQVSIEYVPVTPAAR